MTILKDKRLQIGKDIKEIAEITRIKRSYLKAIEEEDFSKLPVEVYTKAYIKQYAHFLGVDPDAILERYNEYISRQNIKEQNKTQINDEKTQDIPVKKDTIRKPINYKQILNISLPILAIITVISLILWYQSRQADFQEVAKYTPPPIESPKEPEKNLDNKPVETISGSNPVTEQTIQSQKEGFPQMTTPITKDKPKYNLNLVATETVWIQVLIDNKEKKEITLNPGDTVSYDADSSFVLLIGNAGGVKVNFNGKMLDRLGESGKVVRLKLPNEDRRT